MADPIETHITANMNMNKKQIMLANFLGGLSWGVGSVVGAGVVVAIIGAVLNQLGVFSALKNLPQIPQGFK